MCTNFHASCFGSIAGGFCFVSNLFFPLFSVAGSFAAHTLSSTIYDSIQISPVVPMMFFSLKFLMQSKIQSKIKYCTWSFKSLDNVYYRMPLNYFFMISFRSIMLDKILHQQCFSFNKGPNIGSDKLNHTLHLSELPTISHPFPW
jgi:hypothetical protein